MDLLDLFVGKWTDRSEGLRPIYKLAAILKIPTNGTKNKLF